MKLSCFFLRHAESEANKGVFFSDPSAPPLTPRGISSSIEFAKKCELKFDRIIHSNYKRASQTALFISKYLNVDNIELNEHIFEFKYHNAKNKSEWIRATKKLYYENLEDFFPSPNCESIDDVLNRALSFLIEQVSDKRITLVISHEMMIKAMMTIIKHNFIIDKSSRSYFFDYITKCRIQNLELLGPF